MSDNLLWMHLHTVPFQLVLMSCDWDGRQLLGCDCKVSVMLLDCARSLWMLHDFQGSTLEPDFSCPQ